MRGRERSPEPEPASGRIRGIQIWKATCSLAAVPWIRVAAFATLLLKGRIARATRAVETRCPLTLAFTPVLDRSTIQVLAPIPYGDGKKDPGSGWVIYTTGKDATIHHGLRKWGRQAQVAEEDKVPTKELPSLPPNTLG